jgi:hypothetical protein
MYCLNCFPYSISEALYSAFPREPIPPLLDATKASEYLHEDFPRNNLWLKPFNLSQNLTGQDASQFIINTCDADLADWASLLQNTALSLQEPMFQRPPTPKLIPACMSWFCHS